MSAGYQGYGPPTMSPVSPHGSLRPMQNMQGGRSPVIRSSSMYVSNNGPPGNLRYQPSLSRPPQRPRYAEPAIPEHQHQRQYEQFEQQARYYRDANPSTISIQDQPQPQPPRVDTYGAPYRHSTYQGVYAGPAQPRPGPPTLRQQQIQQLQAQRTLNLGHLGPNRFSVASRDQLPTAPSPSVFSATQPEPNYTEARVPSPKPTEDTTGSTLHPSMPTDSLPLSEPGTPVRSSQEPYRRGVSRNSVYSVYSMGSPVTGERIPRPMSAVIEPSPRLFSVSPNSIHSALGPSHNHNSLARAGSDPHWTTAAAGNGGNSVLLQAKARAAQSNACYSHQVTLSSIPVNEEVPPMPGKMTSKTGKVRIQLTFDRPFFNAGGELSGRLEVQCSSSRSVMLADMIVELLGYEALAKDHLTPKIFHKTVLRLQDIRHPSQAVQENIEPDSDGYWMARKGRTIFPFRLSIQDSLPNSYDSKLGQVRYVVSAIALMKANQSKEVVNHTRECFIYETWTTDDITQARRRSVKADTSKRLFMGGDGSLELYAELTRTMVSSGGIVYVNVGVKNLTKKKIMGIKLSLWRHIAASSSRSSFSSHSSTLTSREQDNVKNYSEIIYKGEDFAFDNDDPRVVVLPVYIPSGVYSLRHTSYLHVQFFVQVSLMASMSKALAVELPIYITHASSWSDPPPRIPRDFTFPMHEDEPVKKNKTGVFSKMKPSSIATQQSGCTNGSGLKKSSGLTGSSSNLSGLASAASSKPATPNASDVATMDVDSTRPSTRRSTLRDPDSPTSVLDFSQAGNLFVVNPDAASINTSSESGSIMKQTLATHSMPPPTQVIESRPSSPEKLASPLDRSAPLMLVDTLSPKTTDEVGIEHPSPAVEDEEQDFDMSRAISVSSQPNLTKRNSDKSNKSSKMGLRKTLAKLSIAIPTHGGSGHHSITSKSSKRSPRVLPSTPRSSKSVTLSSEELGSPGSRSDPGDRSLSRQSSSSSLRSFNHIFERHSHSRKSSTGSPRVANISPESESTDTGSFSLSKMTSSSTGSAPPSNITSAYPSRSSSPALPSASSSNTDNADELGQRERHHEIGQLAMTPAIPDVRLHRGTPLMNETGREGYFEANDDDQQPSRPTTPSPSENQFTTVQSSPATPYSGHRPWDMPRNFSTTSLASSAHSESGQSAQEIRDEYYYGRSHLSRNMSADSLDIRIAPPQIGVSAESAFPALYSNTNEIYEDSDASVQQQHLDHDLPADREMYGSAVHQQQQQNSTANEDRERHIEVHNIVQDALSQQQQQQQSQHEQLQHLEYQQQLQQQQLQQIQELHQRQQEQQQQQQQQAQQQNWNNERYEEPTLAPAVVQPPVDQMLDQRTVMEGYSSIPPSAQHLRFRLNEVSAGTGLVLPLVQSPDAYYKGDDYVHPPQTRTLSNHSSRPHSRTSSSHSVVVDPSGVTTPRSAISIQQMENLSRSSTPLVRDPILRNTSMENVVTYVRSDPSTVLAQSHHQQLSPMGQEQSAVLMSDGQQYTPEIYSTPMMSQGDFVLENNGSGLADYSHSAANSLSQTTIPLSTSTSFQSDNLRLTPNDLGINMQLGANSGIARDQQQQFLAQQASNATGYSGAPTHREAKYSIALQPDLYSPHPSRSNSRQVSPKQWHAEAILPAHVQHSVVVSPSQHPQQKEVFEGGVPVQVVQQPVVLQPAVPILNEYQQQQQDGEQHLIIVDASQPPGVAYQAVVDYQTSEMQAQAMTPALMDDQQSRFESHSLQHSVYKEEIRQTPYQPRTQYMPASNSNSAVGSAVPSASASPLSFQSNALSPSAMAVATGAGCDVNAAYIQQHSQPAASVLEPVPVGLVNVVSPPPIPGRPWSQVPSVIFGDALTDLVSMVDHQSHYQPQPTSYVSMAEQQQPQQVPAIQRGIEDVAAVAMALRTHKETVDRQGELARQQEELVQQQEVLAHQEALARQEALALAQQEVIARQNAIAQQQQQQQELEQELGRQEAHARQQEATTHVLAQQQQEALVYQQQQQEQQLHQHQQAQQLHQQQKFQIEQQQLLFHHQNQQQQHHQHQQQQQQQQQQIQDGTRFSGANLSSVVSPGSAIGGSPLETPVISPPIQQPSLQNNPGLARALSDQELAKAYRMMSPRGYFDQEDGSITPVGRGSITPSGGMRGGASSSSPSSLVVPPDAIAELTEAIRSIQTSPVGHAGPHESYVYHQQQHQQQHQEQHLQVQHQRLQQHQQYDQQHQQFDQQHQQFEQQQQQQQQQQQYQKQFGLVPVPPRAIGDDEINVDSSSRRPSPLVAGDKQEFDEDRWRLPSGGGNGGGNGGGGGGLSVTNPDQ
ncbi:MAG: hypothetical protein J3R72DRAFT_454522 [Linnemannia gamsii]|nr:MAG: hypothetical protein J3R72DRAFT_454522 [Linnemannia gamsii]